ncbi:MAG: hypothetical protein M1818_006639 [Claussenomyces sp. TS43310]|nr:MAG: hypothetical protein M1818_006639 [Claussenomyces sp. TS43310]
MNLIVAFAVALKHKLRFEPYVQYDDLSGLVNHLDTFARAADEPGLTDISPKSPWKRIGEYLGISFAESNPRKLFKKAKKPLGNMPLEILTYLSTYVESKVADGAIKVPLASQFLLAIATMTEIQTGTERVVNTPLPVAYSIVISQVMWIYVLVLPFQLFTYLEWITIPASIVAAYIILSLGVIGQEIENPFGHDVNDLPLDVYCQDISTEIEILTALAPPKPTDFIPHDANQVLFPLSTDSHSTWSQRSVEDIRSALKARAILSRRGPVEMDDD